MKTEEKNRHLHAKVFVSVLVLFALILSLFSCGINTDFVSTRLDELGVPKYDTSKLKGVEMVYRDYYVENLPDVSELTEKTADIYFEKYHSVIDTSDKSAVTDALIYSYIEVIGDKYSVYRTAEEYKEYNSDMSGSFFGIGVSILRDRDENTITITEIFEGGGAYEAGLLAGDIITKVNGNNVSDIGYDAAVDMIRGELNSHINITVLRGSEELTFSVIRKKVIEKTVTYSVNENNIGYIKISSFKSNTPSQFREAVDYMEKQKVSGIIYDLRSNPGGWLESVVDMLSYIAPTGSKIVSFTNDYANPRKDNHINSVSLPSVVICNGHTASAGELFTAAMRDFGELGYFDVTIVGEKTFGKGIMQNTYQFTDDSAITLTVAYYNPPLGKNYNGEGIHPDVPVELGESGDGQLDAAYIEISKLINK